MSTVLLSDDLSEDLREWNVVTTLTAENSNVRDAKELRAELESAPDRHSLVESGVETARTFALGQRVRSGSAYDAMHEVRADLAVRVAPLPPHWSIGESSAREVPAVVEPPASERARTSGSATLLRCVGPAGDRLDPDRERAVQRIGGDHAIVVFRLTRHAGADQPEFDLVLPFPLLSASALAKDPVALALQRTMRLLPNWTLERIEAGIIDSHHTVESFRAEHLPGRAGHELGLGRIGPERDR
ncbi:MAG: hypothetical protein ACOYNI_09565 [Acidimicrobiia bacterium]